MARPNKKKMASRSRKKRSVLLRLALVIIVTSVLWNLWPDAPVVDTSPEPPPIVMYAEQPARNDWPPLPDPGSNFPDSIDLLKHNYYVILDASARMAQSECNDGRNNLSDAIDALSTFIDAVPPDANIGVSVFNNNRIMEIMPLQSGVSLNTAMLSQMVPAGATPQRSAIHHAYAEMVSQGERQLGYGEYHVVVISGGMATEGEDPAAVIRQMLLDSPVNFHTVGFCSGLDLSLDQPGFISYRAVDNLVSLKQGLSEVLAEAPSFTLDSFQEAVPSILSDLPGSDVTSQ